MTPDTLLRWRRQLIGKNYDGSQRITGRPPVAPEIAKLVVRMAKENPSSGYTRIQGALSDFGHQLGRNTIARILADHGIEPAPRRGMSRETFLRSHWEAIAAADMFTVEVWRARTPVRHHVIFAVGLATRRVKILGIVPEPYGSWIEKVARNATNWSRWFPDGQSLPDHRPRPTLDSRRSSAPSWRRQGLRCYGRRREAQI